MRPTERPFLSQQHQHRSFDDLFHLSRPVHDFIFADQAVDLDTNNKAGNFNQRRAIMPQTMPTDWATSPSSRPIGAVFRRRPKSEPICISNAHLSYDHDVPQSPLPLHLNDRIRQLTAKGEPIVGSPLQFNFLDVYQAGPTSQTSSRASSPASSVRSSLDLDAFSIVSEQSTVNLDFEEDDDGHLQTFDSEIETQFQFDTEDDLEGDYRAIFTSIRNIPNLVESTLTSEDLDEIEDAPDSSCPAPSTISLINAQPQMEAHLEQVPAQAEGGEEERMRVILELAAELRQISLEYEQRRRLEEQQRNTSQRHNQPNGVGVGLKAFFERLHQYALSKLFSLKHCLQMLLQLAFGRRPPAPADS